MVLNLPGARRNMFGGNTSSDEGFNRTQREYIMSIPGLCFRPTNPDIDNISYALDEGSILIDGDPIDIVCPVLLPHGAEIIEVIVYGSAQTIGKTWNLNYNNWANTLGSTIASANVNSADITIQKLNNANIVNNEDFCYHLYVAACDTSSQINGAKIKYIA